MKRVLLALLMVVLLLIIKVIRKEGCRKVEIIKFSRKNRYCVMYTKEGEIIIDKRCYYGKRIVCGVKNGKTIFPYLSFLSG